MDPSSLSNILGQETIKKIYEDGLSEPTKEVGKTATDIVKTLRLFLLPFQLGAAYQDRFAKYLDEVRNAVPEANQVECPPSLAGPVFDKLKYLEDGNYLKDLYLNLLKRAIDKERINEAHPAFTAIIEQLSPDEALILKFVAENRFRLELKIDTVVEVGSIPTEHITDITFPLGSLSFEQKFSMYVEHLKYLNLIDTPQYNMGEPDPTGGRNTIVVHRHLVLSAFGNFFIMLVSNKKAPHVGAFLELCSATLWGTPEAFLC